MGGDILRAVEDLDGAVEMYKNALKINHENFFACYGAGMCFLVAGEDNMAIEMFDWALKYNPSFIPALEALKKCKQS
jgi:tetratricopeptide (TPR) repeat protein